MLKVGRTLKVVIECLVVSSYVMKFWFLMFPYPNRVSSEVRLGLWRWFLASSVRLLTLISVIVNPYPELSIGVYLWLRSVTRLTLVVFENHVVSRWSLLHFYGNPRAYSRAWSLGVSRKWASLELFIPWASRAMICLLRCLLVLNGHYWVWWISCDQGLPLFY